MRFPGEKALSQQLGRTSTKSAVIEEAIGFKPKGCLVEIVNGG